MRPQLAALMSCILLAGLIALPAAPALGQANDEQRPAQQHGGGILKSEFLYERAPFPSCHASTVAQAADGALAVAFFGGTDEGEADVGIWLCRHDGKGWSAPVEVATGVTPGQGNRRFPCWNPVLFQPAKGPLLLFYKVGPTPREWWGMLITSSDGGKTWSAPARLPDGILGPIKNKPVQLQDGTLLCGASVETVREDDWFVHMERTPDLGKTWSKTESLNDGKSIAAIQPTILTHPDGRLQALCRTRQRRVAESWSGDGGKTWEPLKLTALPNPNSGIDAVTLKDGRALMVYNHTSRGRSPLNVAVSQDGKTWKAGPALETEPGEFSYPAVIQASDGKVHVTYTWTRKRIKHATLDPQALTLSDFPAR